MSGIVAVGFALLVAGGIALVVLILDNLLSKGTPEEPAVQAPVIIPPTVPHDADEEITIVGFAPMTLDDTVTADWADSDVVTHEDLGQTHPIVHDADAADEEPSAAHALILVSAVGQTHRGRRRSNNQDAYAVLESHHLFIVADGMGGYAGGEIASQLTVETMERAFQTNEFTGSYPKDLYRDGAQLAASIQMSNRAIWEHAQNNAELEGMGTTCVAARFSPRRERLFIGHVGDSRCYRWRERQFEALTTDHNLANMGIAGRNGHMLTRAVGIGPGVEVDLIIAKPMVGDGYLLCSDGLNKMVEDEQIAEVLGSERSAEDKVETLVNMANEAGGKDNITVILVEVAKPG